MTAFFQWGNVPQWVGVIGAVGSAAVAARTFVVNSRDHRAACARRVWPISVSYAEGAPTASRNHVNALVRNDSDEPIFDCSLESHRWDCTRESVRTRESRLSGTMIGTINAHSDTETYELPVDPHSGDKVGRNTGRPALQAPLSLSFCDGQGREWIRYPDGVLDRRR